MKIVVSEFNNPAFNLAAEEYLFSKSGEDYLLLYINESSVIIGSNQAVVNEVDLDFCIENGILVIRRLSGGGAVYHDKGNFNYSFIHDKSDAPLSSQFLMPIVEVLKRLGINADIGKRKDLWLDEFKISGTASHISKGRELHHGTLLYDTNHEMLWGALSSRNRELIQKATQSVVSPVINIRNFILNKNGDAPESDKFFDKIINELVIYYNVEGVNTFNSDDLTEIEKIQKSKYTNRDWNYRK